MKHLKKITSLFLIAVFSLALLPGCKGKGFSVSADLAPGIYAAPQTVALTAEKNRPVFYTLDGTDPVILQADGNGGYAETGSTKLYKEPIAVQSRASERPRLAELGKEMWESGLKGDYNGEPEDYHRGTVIKAAALEGKRLGTVWTGSYFIMDETEAVQFDLPVISIALSEACLFSRVSDANPLAPQGGIYRYPNNNIEYLATFEFFDKNRNLIFFRDGGLKVSSGKNAGGAPMKSFNVNLNRGAYNAPVEYSMWGNVKRGGRQEPVTSFSRFRLRNAGDSYLNGGFNQVLAQSLASDLLPANASAVYTAVFLNGDFWGIYALEEHYSREYLSAHYGEQEKNIIQIGFDTGCDNEPLVEDGDEEFAKKAYGAMYDFASANKTFSDSVLADFESKYLAVDEYIDQTLTHIYFNCSDYPGNNNRMWRVQGARGSNPYADGRWRPMLYDLDRAFNPDYPADYDMLGHMLGELPAPKSVGGANRNPEWSTLFFRRLWTNASFRNRFLTRAQYFHDTVLSPSRVSEHADAIYDELKNSRSLQASRWMLDINLETNRDGYKVWIEERKALVMSQISQRLS